MTHIFRHDQPIAEPKSQAQRIFRRFGGVPKLKAALAKIGVIYNVSTLYRWDLSKASRGTGGVIPSTAMPDVLKAAQHAGVKLTAADIDPRRTP